MKQFFKKLFRGLWYLLWYSLAAIIVLVAAIFGVLRLLLPLIGDYNQDVERYAESFAGRPIKIMSLDAEWHGFSPSLVLNNVRLLSKDGKETLIHFSRARLDFDLYEIIKTGQVQFRRFKLSGANISLVRLDSGEFSLAGFENSSVEASDDAKGDTIDWLLAQGELSLHARNFIFRDQLNNNKRYYFSDLNLTLRNQLNRHLIDGSMEFNKRLKQEFQFAADIRGDIFSKNNWSGKVYVNGQNLNINKLLGPINYQQNNLELGESSFEVWSDWQNATLTGLQGNVSLNGISLKYSKAPPVNQNASTKDSQPVNSSVAKSVNTGLIEYQNISGRFIWDKYQTGWRAQIDKLQITHNQRLWPDSQLTVHYFTGNDAKKTVNLQSSFIRFEHLIPVLQLLPKGDFNYQAIVDQYSPKGDLENVNFRWNEQSDQFDLAAKLKKINLRQYLRYPGVSGLSGVLRMQNDRGSLKINSGFSSFSLPNVFRSEITLNRIEGTVDWQSGDEGMSVSSKDLQIDADHFQAQAVLNLDLPHGEKSPFLSVITKFSNVNATKVPLYYPVSIMGKGALNWLDSAFLSGDILKGGAIFYGPVNEFPFTRGQGVFDVRFQAKNVTLDYSKDWPKLHSADASVVFRGNTLEITSDRAKIFDSNVSNIKASISDLGADVLKLNLSGKITGKTQDKLKYMLTAPQLKAKYERGLTDLRTEGNSELDLDIGLSIGKDVDADVKGKIKFQNNKLELVRMPDLLDSINGEVDFHNSTIEGKGIEANLLEQPVTVSVRNQKIRNYRVVEYRAVGRFNAKSIAKSQFPLFHDMVDGDAQWVVKFQIPDGERDPQLIVESNLRGVSLNLPVPFKKEKSDSRRMVVSTIFRGETRVLMKISYSGNFEGILENDYTQDMWLKRGELRFGGGPAVLPGSEGLRIAGDIDELSYDVWENLINQLIELKNKENPPTKVAVANSEPDPYFNLVTSVNLNARQFEIFGQKDSNARIKMDNRKTWLAVDIQSEKFSGNIKIPDNLNSKPLVLDMERLNITPVEESGGKIDPRDLPSIKLNSRSMNYGDKKLGQVAVETSKQVNGLLVQQLIVKPRATTIKGHGSWFVGPDLERAVLELVIDSKDLGKTMKDLGYVDTIADGVGRVNVKLNWPASLLDPDLHNIAGQVSLNLEDGRILDIEPGGAARLLGLFSLQTLPRRLMLDFSDLFSKGLKFDVIKGDFKIEQGDAYTSNLNLLGPNANVLLKGRIGLGAQDYDQKVKVTPHITDTTILLSIITSQPLLFLFQQLLKQDIEAATSFEYTLSGKWDNYKLTPILKVSPPAPEQPDDF